MLGGVSVVNIVYKSKSDKFLYSHMFNPTPMKVKHWHHNDHNEILVFMKGNSKFSVEGTTYILKPYDILIIRASEMHRVYHLEPSTPYERFVYHIPDSFFVKNDCENLKKIFTARPLGMNNLIPGEMVKDHCVMDVLKETDDLVTQYDVVPENVLRGKLVEFLFHLNQLHGKTLKSDYVSDKVREIIMYLNDNLESKITLDVLAERFFMSKSYLCHLFKGHTGLTVNQYVKQKRFIRVKELRAEGLSLTDACMRAGFGTYSNFYKMYLNEMGKAPSEDLK